MTYITSFAPIEGNSARVLILGSIPGIASTSAGQYYAHPRNSFWNIVGAILGFSANTSYEEKVETLKRSSIALWDVLEHCTRPGSMDADIDMRSAKPNDIIGLLRRQPGIDTICFNGIAAEKIFNQYVLPTLADIPVKYIRLPSTSPAHATMSFEKKLIAWRVAINA